MLESLNKPSSRTFSLKFYKIRSICLLIYIHVM